MSETLQRVLDLIEQGEVRVSAHGYNPIHVLWGIPRSATSPAVLVTAYRPDPDRWSSDFLRRKS